MTDQIVVSDDVAKSLCEKLKSAELTREERDLLNAVLRIVWDVTAPNGSPEKKFDAEFDDCFERGQAKVIMEYVMADSFAQEEVIKSVDGASVSRIRRIRVSITGTPPPPRP